MLTQQETPSAGILLKQLLFGTIAASGLPFSPAGRRWPEGSDEGGLLREANITKRRPGRTDVARRLRKHDTEEEYRLWSDLRNRRLNGYKFARQIPLGQYVVDSICREQGLIIEIDGVQHAESPSDVVRTEWLNSRGFSVLRFWNNEVLQERRAVLETILAALEGEIFRRDDVLRFHPAIKSPEKVGE